MASQIIKNRLLPIILLIGPLLGSHAYGQNCLLPGAPVFTALQWNLCNYGQPFRIRSEKIGQLGTVGADIQITEAWSVADSSPYITVAVIDSGFDLSHPDLTGVFLSRKQKSFLDPSGKIQPPNSIMGVHGNIVSGIIGANGRNSIGITGISKEVRIIPIQAIPQGMENEDDKTVAEAIVYAVDAGARIINCSFGKYSTSLEMEKAIQYAQNKGVLIVASVGNDLKDISIEPHWPSSYSTKFGNVISVAATDRTDQLWSRSNFGREVDLAAPGDEILSTAWYSTDPFNLYFSPSGTSMAAPHVSAVAALMLQVNGALEPEETKKILLETADRGSALIGKVNSGRLNSFLALKKAKEGLEKIRLANRCDFHPDEIVPEVGRKGHSAFWTLKDSPVLSSEIFYSNDRSLEHFAGWVESHTKLSVWENLLVGLSIVKKAEKSFRPQEPIVKDLRRMAYNYQAIHDGVGKVRRLNCLESLLFKEFAKVVDLTKDRSEFSALLFKKEGKVKLFGTFLNSSFSGSSDSEAVKRESARLTESGWQLVAHIHNHPFRLDGSEEIAGHLSASQVDLHLYRRLKPQKALITNGMETIEFSASELLELRAE